MSEEILREEVESPHEEDVKLPDINEKKSSIHAGERRKRTEHKNQKKRIQEMEKRIREYERMLQTMNQSEMWTVKPKKKVNRTRKRRVKSLPRAKQERASTRTFNL